MKKITSTGLIAFAFLFGTASCNQQQGATEQAQETNEQAFEDTSMEEQKDDLSEFMTEAASGGMFEVEAGKLVQQKGQNQSVKDFGQMMVTDHSKANNELKSLASQKSIMLPDSMGQEHMDKMRELREKTGAEFDEAYVDIMVKDHNEDVNSFEEVSNNLHDPEVKAFAAKTLPVLRQHQDRVKQIDETLSNN